MPRALVAVVKVFMSEDLFQEIKWAAERAEFERLSRDICDEIDEYYAKILSMDKSMYQRSIEEFKKKREQKKSWFKRFKFWSHSSTE